MISTPRGVTSVEERAVHDAAMQAGAGAAYLIPEPLAAAYGAGLPIGTPTGNMVVDMGGGTTEAAVVSMYDIVVWSSVRVGGNRLDESIINYVRKKYNLLIGEQTAEEIKIAIGSALPLEDERQMEVRGRDQVNGLPRTIQITSSEVTEAMTEPLQAIISTVRATLEKTPPELAADIIDRGMVMTGGGSQLRNIADLLTQQTGVPCYVAENPNGLCGPGRGQGPGELRNHAAQPAGGGQLETGQPLSDQSATSFHCRSLHDGRPTAANNAVTRPIRVHPTPRRPFPWPPPSAPGVSYIYDRTEDLDAALGGNPDRFVYHRYGNPTVQAFERAVAAKVPEGADEDVVAFATASGMAAIQLALMAAGAQAGATIAVAQDCYGATFALVEKLWNR